MAKKGVALSGDKMRYILRAITFIIIPVKSGPYLKGGTHG